MNRLKLLAAAGFTLLALTACTEDRNLASKDPAVAAKNLAVALHDNDFDRLSHIAVTPDMYTKLAARLKDKEAKEPTPSDLDRKRFADQVQQISAPDAEETLFKNVQPTLAQYGPQIPMAAAAVSGTIQKGVDQSEKLSADDKNAIRGVLTAITKWATTAPLADPDKAKQAIKIIVATGRDLKLTTLDAFEKLSYQELAQKSGTAFGGMRKALAVFGLDTDKALDSVTTVKKSESGDDAVVTVSFTLQDTAITFNVAMVKIDDRWYAKDAIDQGNDTLNAPADSAAAPMAGPVLTMPATGSAPSGGG